MTDVSLIIIQYGEVGLVETLLDSLRNHPDRRLISEVIIVDNGLGLTNSQRDSLLTDNLVTAVVQNEEEGYASGINTGVEASTGDALILSNNDVEWLSEHSIEPALKTMAKPEVGVVGPQLVFPDGTWQRSYGRIPSITTAMLSILFLDSLAHLVSAWRFKHNVQGNLEPGYIDGAFMIVDRICFERVGGFDQSFEFYVEDAEFCMRARQMGWNLLFEPGSRIKHIRGASSSSSEKAEYSRRLLQAKRALISTYGGEIRARIFVFLTVLHMWERKVVYGLAARLLGGPWEDRAEQAADRFSGIFYRERE